MDKEKKKVKERIEHLRKTIDYYRYQYHVLDKQEISDSALDALKHELFLLEQKYPEFITPDSPTQRIGGKPLDKFKKIKHRHRMLSLFDIFDKQELLDWEVRLKNILPNVDWTYYCELKIDGLAISLIYENGILKTGATRGDGFIGEDVTQNIKTIEAIPLKIPYKQRVEVRGEVYMTKKVFEEINRQQEQAGKPIYANPRNLAAGSVRQLDPKVTASRKLSFFAYDMLDIEIKTHSEVHKKLQEFGFKITPYSKECKDIFEVYKYCVHWIDKRNSMPFQIDGIVISVNQQELYKKFGIVGKAPRWSIAYKFPAEQAVTEVKDVRVQVGRTGVLTPVAILKPVRLAGSIITHATLHNFEEIKRLGIKKGDTVIIEKAGDIIPSIVKVLKRMRTGKEQDIIVPKKCPICKSPVVHKKGLVAVYCSNPNCFGSVKESIIHFVSKQGFNIQGLGRRIVENLLEKNIIFDAADLFFLKKDDLVNLEGFGEKSADNLLKQIENSKEIDLGKFIYSLGIRFIGIENSFLLKDFLLKKYKVIETPNQLLKIMGNLTEQDLYTIKGLGEKSIQSILRFFTESRNIEFLKKLNKAGIKFLKPINSNQSSFFFNKTFLMTGSFEHFSREQVYDIIREKGGKVLSSVSSNLDYLLVGKKPGSKLERAKKLKIKILTEEKFLKLLK